ncbi:MAG: phosphate butyryltransferase [Clostridia bacterium]|nr:phosphate butyryltransferase [Clostridia bacterium]MDN5321838.1 phosphate butyryltransferase [Clostridia bacterium]
MKSFKELQEKVVSMKEQRYIAVAVAQDEEVLKAIKGAKELGLAEPILIGDEKAIREAATNVGLSLDGVRIEHETKLDLAAKKAVSLVSSGQANIVMKGLIGTSPFLKAVLDKEVGLRTDKILSHVAVFEIPGYDRLLVITDAAMNIAPGLNDKVKIINNALVVTRSLGIEKAKVAPVCAVETVNPDMPATIDAAALTLMSERGQIEGAIIDGPLALDNAISLEAAKHKGITSPVAGHADILLCPDIEAGNMTYKALVYLGNAEVAGVIIGAKAPVVLTSRADTYISKLNSIALSLLACKTC